MHPGLLQYIYWSKSTRDFQKSKFGDSPSTARRRKWKHSLPLPFFVEVGTERETRDVGIRRLLRSLNGLMGERGRGEVSSSMSRMHKKNIAKTWEKLIFGSNRACQIRNKGKHVMRPFKAFFLLCFFVPLGWGDKKKASSSQSKSETN